MKKVFKKMQKSWWLRGELKGKHVLSMFLLAIPICFLLAMFYGFVLDPLFGFEPRQSEAGADLSFMEVVRANGNVGTGIVGGVFASLVVVNWICRKARGTEESGPYGADKA